MKRGEEEEEKEGGGGGEGGRRGRIRRGRKRNRRRRMVGPLFPHCGGVGRREDVGRRGIVNSGSV